MAETATASLESEVVELPHAPQAQVVRLKLRKPKPQKKVDWSSDTVDNEHMNKKKSKCCCVYVKPHKFGESSSESDDECEHCRGHVELKKKRGHCGGDDQQVPIQASSDDHFKT